MPYQPYQPNSTIRDLILQRGDIAARGAQNSAAIWGGALQNVAGVADGYFAQRAEQKKADAISKRDTAFLTRLEDTSKPMTARDFVGFYGPQEGLKLYNGWASLKSDKPDPKLIVAGLRAASPALRAAAWPDTHGQLVAAGVPAATMPALDQYDDEFTVRLLDQLDPPKEGGSFTLGAGDVRFGPDGKQIAAGPAAAPKADTRTVDVRLAEAAASGDRATYDALINMERDKAAATRGPAAPRAPENKIWITRDGKPAFVPESEVRPGDAPQKAGRDLRPVTAVDARQLSGFDSGVNDAKELRAALSKNGATGIGAWLGTKVPALATEMTGLGSESKQKQALIALVKQSIGKTLEGGVLRKEDEVKYRDILPLIEDSWPVVQSKLEGLERKMREDKQLRIEALDNAGFDVSRFVSRSQIGGSVSGRIGQPVPPRGAPAEPIADGPNGPIVLRNGQWVPLR